MPNGKLFVRALANRSSQRAANLWSRSYAANIAMTAAMARAARKLLSGGRIPASHTRTSRYGRFFAEACLGGACPRHRSSSYRRTRISQQVGAAVLLVTLEDAATFVSLMELPLPGSLYGEILKGCQDRVALGYCRAYTVPRGRLAQRKLAVRCRAKAPSFSAT